MAKLQQITPKRLVKFFLKQGFKITIAIHNKPIAPGTFSAILRQSNLKRSEFLKLFQG